MSGKGKGKEKDKHPPCEDHKVDILIVGAGLAGLHSALQLSERFPKAKICIAEAYNYTGGRVLTYSPKGFPGIQWEMGAGRIHRSHHRILSYCSDYGLTILPISSESIFVPETTKVGIDDPWPHTSSAINTLLHKLKPDILATNTVDTLLKKVTGDTNQLMTFPYSAETHVLRADMALQSFQKEMGSSEGFVIVKEGLSALIDGMVKELKHRGVVFLFDHRLVDLDTRDCKAIFANECTISYNKCIVALHAKALKQIPITQKLPAVQNVLMCPLLRIYAIFETHKGRSWFSDIPKIVTDSPLRFIIPINPTKGVIMISYTDASDTEFWNSILEKKGLSGLQDAIMKEVRKLFPDRHIPDPLYLKPHPWSEGCSYWKAGSYSVKEMSESIINPIPNVYICNESFSTTHQCWMEGALDHADEMLKHFFS